jgi:hypothetical protein
MSAFDQKTDDEDTKHDLGLRYQACYQEAMDADQSYDNPVQTVAKFMPVVGTLLDAGDCGYYSAAGDGPEAAKACTGALLGTIAGGTPAGKLHDLADGASTAITTVDAAASPSKSPPVSMRTVDGQPVDLSRGDSITSSIASQVPADANFSPADPHVLPYHAE